MTLFSRIKRIILSNIDTKEDNINLSDYDIGGSVDNSYQPKNEEAMKYYAILEVPEGAPFSKIKTSYKRLLKKYHPDFYAGDEVKYKKAQELTKKINEAYSYFERRYQ